MSTSRVLIVAVSIASLLAACITQPPARQAIATLPPLDADYSRVFIGAGMHRGDTQTTAQSNVREVGPVYFNGRLVGSTGQNEYFVVDVKPGTYEVYCSPLEPVRNLTEKRSVSFAAGETKYLVCEMAPPGADQWQEYQSRTYLEERRIDLQASRLVANTKLP
jgi:hypothetical protein